MIPTSHATALFGFGSSTWMKSAVERTNDLVEKASRGPRRARPVCADSCPRFGGGPADAFRDGRAT